LAWVVLSFYAANGFGDVLSFVVRGNQQIDRRILDIEPQLRRPVQDDARNDVRIQEAGK
jgi:hypothetical protein